MPVIPKLRGTGRPANEKPIANYDDTVTRMESSRPTLVARARKRDVSYVGKSAGADIWIIQGDHKLGDAYPTYEVSKEPREKKYDCSCYHTSHGETRSRRICSHVMAVILWRQAHPEFAATSLPRVAATDDRPGSEDPAPSSLAVVHEAPPAHVEPSETDMAPWSPRDPRLTPQGFGDPPPEWVESYRQTQWDAALETVEAFENGKRVVFVDAPTGSGKTLYGDLVARLLQQPAVYMCTTKTLQDQVLSDFPYARVLKGRANYPTMNATFPDITCDDCDGQMEADDCTYCSPMHACPYRRAKAQAVRSQLAVVNVAYWLREANFVGAFSIPPDPSAPAGNSERPGARRRREGGLFIVDECDTMEDQLLSFVEFSLTRRRLQQLGLRAPRKGVHKKTYAEWMQNELIPALVKERQRNERLGGLAGSRNARGLAVLEQDAERVALEAESENWIRDYSQEDRLPFSLKPVRVDGYGRLLWRNMGRTIMMSATIISPEELARSLGLENEYAVVRMPMAFPVENRMIRVAPIANMIRSEEAAETPKLLRAIERILEKHPDDRTLIHTVSYARAMTIIKHLRSATDRVVVTYTQASEREQSLAMFRATPGAVMVAPSFERGVDLKDDDCRVQIIAKVPYPHMGDPRTSQRAHGPDGDAWVAVQTIRALVQMTGRAVRTETDYCETYILDEQFTKNLLRRNGSLLPTWWRDALDKSFRVKDLL